VRFAFSEIRHAKLQTLQISGEIFKTLSGEWTAIKEQRIMHQIKAHWSRIIK
jgi:hypothetical protein